MFERNEFAHNHAAARTFMPRVFGWMFLGLMMSAGMAYYLSPAVNPVLFTKLVNGPLMLLMFAQFGIVLMFSSMWKRISYVGNIALFSTYSLLSGVTLSPLTYVYTGESLATTFAIAASIFAVMALYGYLTKADLTSVGSFAMMGLFGLIIALFANWMIGSEQFSFYISAFAVLIFTALTAYDVQKLKQVGQYLQREDAEYSKKFALVGALHIYLDLLNIFIYLLHLMGKRR